jgi:hypothetical protein
MIASLLLSALVAAPSSAQLGPSVAGPVPVSGALVRPGVVWDAAAMPGLSRVTVRAIDHDGSSAQYRGARVADIVHAAGVPVGGAVRGAAARAYVRVSATDGYAAIFSLAELQTTQAQCAPILAETRNGWALTAGVGPLRIVAPCDRTHARWVRGVTRLTVIVSAK